MCNTGWGLREVLLSAALRKAGTRCSGDLGGSVWTCLGRGWSVWGRRSRSGPSEAVRPAAFRKAERHCFSRSSLERLDFSGTRVACVDSSLCHGCSELREIFLPAMLMMLGWHCLGWEPQLGKLA
jgi:hypothetical protein